MQESVSDVPVHPLNFIQIRIENTNICAYKCIMCPREKLTREAGIMPLEDLELVLDRVGTGAPEIHLHGYGEPLLDKTLPDKARLVKERCPESRIIFFSTLGIKLDDDFFHRLVESGVHAIRISCYGFTPKTYKAIHGVDRFRLVCENLKHLIEAKNAAHSQLEIYAVTTNASTWKDVPEKEMRVRESFIHWLQSAGVHINDGFAPHNYGGGRGYNKTPSKGLCSIVWGARREILQVTWDMKVIPCCFDFNSSVIFGDLRIQTLKEIFTGEAYVKFIKAHQTNDLSDYPVCLGCERCFLESVHPKHAENCYE